MYYRQKFPDSTKDNFLFSSSEYQNLFLDNRAELLFGFSSLLKIARFEWELPRLEQETRAYRLLEGSDLAPRVLGHIHERGRGVMGILLEKIEGGREASIGDLGMCRDALGRLHEGCGLVHGDANRYKFYCAEGEGEVD